MIWAAVVVSSLFYLVTGIVLAYGYDIDSSNNVLNAIFANGRPAILSKLTIALFAIAMLLPGSEQLIVGIPVSFIVSKNNLVQNKVAPEWVAVICSFILPVFLCIPLQTGTIIVQFQTWSSLIFVSSCNFILPFVLYFKCIQFRRGFNSHRCTTYIIQCSQNINLICCAKYIRTRRRLWDTLSQRRFCILLIKMCI